MLRSIILFAVSVVIVSSPAWAQQPVNKNYAKAPTTITIAPKDKTAPPTIEKAPASTSERPATVSTVKPAVKSQEDMISLSPGELKKTPEMWFYEQYMRQYKDPKAAVRANAEFQASQRQHRIAAMQWFGFSNSRPRACPDPYNGDWSPTWSSNNGAYPYRWNGVGPTWSVARQEHEAVYTY